MEVPIHFIESDLEYIFLLLLATAFLSIALKLYLA